MSWGAVAGAAIGAVGSAVSANQAPSGESPRWLKDLRRNTGQSAGRINPQQYYPENTFVGGLPSEQAAFNQQSQYNQGMYGAGSPYQNVMQAGQNQLSGNTPGGLMANTLSPYASAMALSQFGQGPGQVGRYGFDTNLGFGGPQFGRAGSLDARGALQSMLSGTPDYSGAQGAIDAANAPLLRQLNEEIIPGLNSRATLLSNSTGGIKALNKVLPEIGQRMSQNALGVMEGERQRALQSQQQAAGLVSQGGLQSSQLGLNRSMGQADLQRALAGLNLQTDTTNAGLGSQYRGDVLGLGNLAGNLSGQYGNQNLNWAQMFPGLAQAGAQPNRDAMDYANYQRMLQEGQIAADKTRWDFEQQEPYNRLRFQSEIYGMVSPQGGGQPQGSDALGILGGAVTGAQLGGMFGNAFGGYNPVYQGGGAPMVNQPSGPINVTSPNYDWGNLLGQAYTGG